MVVNRIRLNLPKYKVAYWLEFFFRPVEINSKTWSWSWNRTRLNLPRGEGWLFAGLSRLVSINSWRDKPATITDFTIFIYYKHN